MGELRLVMCDDGVHNTEFDLMLTDHSCWEIVLLRKNQKWWKFTTDLKAAKNVWFAVLSCCLLCFTATSAGFIARVNVRYVRILLSLLYVLSSSHW